MKSLNEILKSSGLSEGIRRASGEDGQLEPYPEDPDDACPRCGGAGFVRKVVRLGHPDFGRAFPCDCTRDEQADEKQVRLLRYSNLGPLSRLTFENLSPRGRSSNSQHQEVFASAARAAEAFAARPEGWLVLTGPSGCGKTHLAAAIANRCIENGHAALFMVVPDLLDHLRAAYQPGAETGYDELFEIVRTAQVLLLDDLGVQSTTPWVAEKLFQLLNHRYTAQLPTVITTNLDLSAFDPRTQSRLTDEALSRIHHLEGGAGSSVATLDSLELTRLKTMTFKTFNPKFYGATADELRSAQSAVRTAMRYAEDPQQWLVFAGPPGRGKTWLAAAIGNYCRESGHHVMFVLVADLLDSLRSAYNPQNPRSFDDTFDKVRNVQVLILDDLGAESGTAWADEKLFQLINYRYNACLPTVFTTNLAAPELAARLAARLTDIELSTILLMGPFDFWGKQAQAAPSRGRGRPRSSG